MRFGKNSQCNGFSVRAISEIVRRTEVLRTISKVPVALLNLGRLPQNSVFSERFSLTSATTDPRYSNRESSCSSLSANCVSCLPPDGGNVKFEARYPKRVAFSEL